MRYLATYLIYLAVIARAIGWNQDTVRKPTSAVKRTARSPSGLG